MNADTADSVLSELAGVSAIIECDGHLHLLRTQGRHLIAVAHDLEAEGAVVALGGELPECIEVVRAWRTALGIDIAAMLGGESFPNPRRNASVIPVAGLGRLMSLREDVRHRWVASALVTEGLRRGRHRDWPATNLFNHLINGTLTRDDAGARAVLEASLWFAGVDSTPEARDAFEPHVFNARLPFAAARELRRPMLEAVVSLLQPGVQPSALWNAIHVNAAAIQTMLEMEGMISPTSEGWKVIPREHWNPCTPGGEDYVGH